MKTYIWNEFWFRVKIGKSYKVLNMAGGAKISDPEKIDGRSELHGSLKLSI